MLKTMVNIMAGALLLALAAPIAAPIAAIEPDAVEAAIQRGRNALIESINTFDLIVHEPLRGGAEPVYTVGRIVSQDRSALKLQLPNGEPLTVPRARIIRENRIERVDHPYEVPYPAGPSALVALALLDAGVEPSHPRLAGLIDGLEKLPTSAGRIYVRSLRAAVWSTLARSSRGRKAQSHYRRLLVKESVWLKKAMLADGGFTYGDDVRGRGWDHSNTQFAHLGLWLADLGGAEIGGATWRLVARHWLEAQDVSGGWTYAGGNRRPTSSMTVAGANSLYIALDRHYAQLDGHYRRLKGVRPRASARRAMRRIYNVLDKADDFLKNHPPDMRQFDHYELFGLERLGRASGLAVIGGRDWFRDHVDFAATRGWGRNPVAEAFRLLFLVYGQAPIIIQKLPHGDDFEAWNYYFRDLSGVTRYLSESFERPFRWQQLPAEPSLEELEDAPFVYIAGTGELTLSPTVMQRLRAYVDRGGTILLHADRAEEAFTRSAKERFTRLFADRGLEFTPLPPTHALYRCHFDLLKDESPPVPLHVLADGPRVLVWLCPVDVAGAWHQDLVKRHTDLFQLMANLRIYAAPPYADLPRRLRSAPRPGRPVAPRGQLRLARLKHAAGWDAHRGAWRRAADAIRHHAGVRLVLPDDDDDVGVDASDLADWDVIHITLRRTLDLPAADRAALESYLQRGGFVLIDAADGTEQAIAGVRALVRSLNVGEAGLLRAGDTLASGDDLGGHSLLELTPTRDGASLHRPGSPPPIVIRTIDGRVAVVACPFDLIGALGGHYVLHRVGYQPDSARMIADNTLLRRLHEIRGKDDR